jgi:hypothetical protein
VPQERGQAAIDAVAARLGEQLDDLPVALEHHRPFLAAYRRITLAVGDAVGRGEFADPDWVGRWDVAFAELYLEALTAEQAPDRTPSRPWRLAFAASPDLPPLRRILLGINAHINYDLPQALLAVIGDEEFRDHSLLERRRADHRRIDLILASRVRAEDQALDNPRSLADRLLTPLNRAGSRRFLAEARQKVWQNTGELQRARLSGPAAYEQRLAELEVLSAAKIADLLAPGQVLLRLTVAGFGVLLPPA